MDDDVLDVPGAAKLLRTGKDAVYAACARQGIPHRRVGRHIRFSRQALLKWLASESTAEATPQPVAPQKDPFDEEKLRALAREAAERMRRARNPGR